MSLKKNEWWAIETKRGSIYTWGNWHERLTPVFSRTKSGLTAGEGEKVIKVRIVKVK